DVDIHELRVTNDEVRITRPAGDIHIPIGPDRVSFGKVNGMFQIPFFGDSNWQTMYDYPKHNSVDPAQTQHYPMTFVWDAILTRRRTANNNKQIDGALKSLVLAATGTAGSGTTDAALTDAFAQIDALPAAGEDPDLRNPVIEKYLNDYGFMVQD